MTDQPRYTLTEAQRELARRECAAHGHSWNVVAAADGRPVRIVCESCSWSGSVTMTAPEPPPVASIEMTLAWGPAVRPGDKVVIRDSDTAEVVFSREITEAEATSSSLGLPIGVLEHGKEYMARVEPTDDRPPWSPWGVFDYRETPTP